MVDFRAFVNETQPVHVSRVFPHDRSRRRAVHPAPRLALTRLSLTRRALTLVALTLAVGCSRSEGGQNALSANGGDPVWQSDSTLLAPHPDVLFRVTRNGAASRIVPLATIGPQGPGLLALSNRGWRALDVAYLFGGQSLTPYRSGRPLAPVPLTRGMWEGPPLDTMPGCSILLPGAVASIPDGVEFFTSGKRPALKPVTPLSAGELRNALEAIPTLIAPTAGIAMAMLPRYRRQVYVAETGHGARPTIIVVYDDPERVADSVRRTDTRPRHFVVVLDRGVYGYKPTFTYTTLGNRRSPPRYRYLDHLDVDDDGQSELLFGLQVDEAPLYTIVLRFQVDAWRELVRNERQRCHG